MRSRASPVNEFSVNGIKMFPYEQSSPGNLDETFIWPKKLRFRRHHGQNSAVFVLYVFPLKLYANKLY